MYPPTDDWLAGFIAARNTIASAKKYIPTGDPAVVFYVDFHQEELVELLDEDIRKYQKAKTPTDLTEGVGQQMESENV